MTDEQIERLRKQIVVYASICEQLVHMHRSFTAQQDFAGRRLGNLYCDPLMATSGRKMTSRHRWAPTPGQLEMLKRVFNEGNVAPEKQKIKEITAELRQHGQISEANAYNWLQNRKARWKRKQSAPMPSNAEAAETLVESPEDKIRAQRARKS